MYSMIKVLCSFLPIKKQSFFWKKISIKNILKKEKKHNLKVALQKDIKLFIKNYLDYKNKTEIEKNFYFLKKTYTNKKLFDNTLVVICDNLYKGTYFYKVIKKIVGHCNIIFVTSEINLKNGQLSKYYSQFSESENCEFFVAASAIPLASRLLEILKSYKASNNFYFIAISQKIEIDSLFRLFKEFGEGDRNFLKLDNTPSPFFSDFKFIALKREFGIEYLKSHKNNSFFLFNDLNYEIDNVNKYFLNFFRSKSIIDLGIKDIAYIFSDSIKTIERKNIYEVSQMINAIFNLYRNILDIGNKKTNFKILLACGAAYITYRIYILDLFNYETLENLKKEFSECLDFDIIPSSEICNFACDYLARILVKKQNNKIIGIENENVNIINEELKCRLQKQYDFIYLKKKTQFSYYNFNNLFLRFLTESCRLVITSGSLNKRMVDKDQPILNLWHGLGLLKKTIVNTKKFKVGTMVCSSDDCILEYAKHFKIKKEDVLSLGSLQTDILFNKSFIRNSCLEVRSKYNIEKACKIIFFAPTFRLEKEHYYNFNFDCSLLSQQLQEHGYVMLIKKHPIFDAILKNTGKNNFFIDNQSNNIIIAKHEDSFEKLLVSSDVFVTDYSSGIFEAACLNKPIVLFADDLKEYQKGRNGLMIDYPNEIPVPFVDKSDPYLFIKKIIESQQLTNTEDYLNFKKHQVGSCDGNVLQKISEYIDNIMIN